MSGEPLLQPIPGPDPETGERARADTSWPTTLLVSGTLTLLLFAALAMPAVVAGPGAVELGLVVVLIILAVVAVRSTFDVRAVRSRGQLSRAVLPALVAPVVVGVGIASGTAVVAGVGVSVAVVAVSAALTATILIVAAALRAVEVRFLRASRRLFLVGTAAQHVDMAREIHRHAGMQLVAFLDVASVEGRGRLDPQEIIARIDRSRATMLVLSRQAVNAASLVAAASQFNLRGGRVRDLGSFYERHFRKTPLSDLTASWFLFDIAEIHRRGAYGFAKRGLDVGVAAALLLLTAPLFVLVAALVRMSGPGPVLFRQQRVGKGGVPFSLVKFRTMTVAEDPLGAAWGGEHAHRVTRVGRLLRRYRLDELPQFWTILRGDMSLVGPRPEQVVLVERLSQAIRFYDARHCVRPGLTGWAQVNSGYGGSHPGTIAKLQLDFYYIRHQSLRLDLLVLLRTLQAVLRGQGSA